MKMEDQAAAITVKKGGVFSRFVENTFKYLMITPMTIILAAISLYPFIFAVRLALTNARTINIHAPKWVGVNNFINILGSTRFWQSTVLTIVYVTSAIVLEVVLGLLLAILVDKLVKAQKWLVSLLITPMLISTILGGIIFRLELNPQFGVFSYYLKQLGLGGNWLDTRHALVSMIFIDVWQWTSFIFLIAFAGLKSLPVEPFEAARVYGAKPWQTFWMVTLPLVRPVLMIAVVFRLMDAFKAFDHIYIMTAGGPDFATTTWSVLAYNYAYTTDHFGRACAMAIILLVIVTLIVKQLLKLAKWR
jgi:multiple sugar transport system permease protein